MFFYVDINPKKITGGFKVTYLIFFPPPAGRLLVSNVLSLQPNKTELAHIWFDLFILVARECVFNAVNWEHYTVYSDCLIEIQQHKSTWYCTLTFFFFFFYLLDQSALPSVVTALLVCLFL